MDIIKCLETGHSAAAIYLYRQCTAQGTVLCDDIAITRTIKTCLKIQSGIGNLITDASRQCIRDKISLGNIDCYKINSKLRERGQQYWGHHRPPQSFSHLFTAGPPTLPPVPFFPNDKLSFPDPFTHPFTHLQPPLPLPQQHQSPSPYQVPQLQPQPTQNQNQNRPNKNRHQTRRTSPSPRDEVPNPNRRNGNRDRDRDKDLDSYVEDLVYEYEDYDQNKDQESQDDTRRGSSKNWNKRKKRRTRGPSRRPNPNKRITNQETDEFLDDETPDDYADAFA